MNFSLRIKELRERDGISQAKLANALQMSISSIGMWESTQEIPPAKKLIRIADYFNVSIDYLLGRTDEPGALLVSSTNFQTTPKEQQMITSYRKLPTQSQEYVYGIIHNLAAHS